MQAGEVTSNAVQVCAQGRLQTLIAAGRTAGVQWGRGVVREGVVDTEETPSVEGSEGGAGG